MKGCIDTSNPNNKLPLYTTPNPLGILKKIPQKLIPLVMRLTKLDRIAMEIILATITVPDEKLKHFIKTYNPTSLISYVDLRYFNGKNWVGPIEINLEHKRFFPGNLGPMTSEMGTLAWYTDNEDEFLFQTILQPFTEFLRSANFRGDFEINCIANADGVYPLEATTRLGTPIIHLQQELHESSWAEFLYAVAKGEDYNLKWKKGYGIVILLAVPPFPYTKNIDQKNIRKLQLK
jgi:hypothetical protein